MPEVVPSEEEVKDECAKPIDDPEVTEAVTAPKIKRAVAKKRKQKGKTHMMHGSGGSGGSGCEHGEKKITIVVHSDVKKILNSMKEKFHEYSKSVKNLNIKITTSPIVSLEKAGDDFVTGEITCKVTVLLALTRDDSKKIKIYVDENLDIK